MRWGLIAGVLLLPAVADARCLTERQALKEYGNQLVLNDGCWVPRPSDDRPVDEPAVEPQPVILTEERLLQYAKERVPDQSVDVWPLPAPPPDSPPKLPRATLQGWVLGMFMLVLSFSVASVFGIFRKTRKKERG